MSAAVFRMLALALPGTEEKAHFGKADFRVRNKIFASLPDGGAGVVKLNPEQQTLLMESEPGRFTPAAGAWGRQGWTWLALAGADKPLLSSVLKMAWENVAPKSMKS